MFSWPRVRLVSFVLLRQKLRVVLQLSTPQLPVIVIVVTTVDGLGAVHGGVELLSALTGGSPGGADPLHGGEDPPDPAEQVEGPVPHGDHSVFGEGDGLAASPRHRELGEDDAGHAGLDDDAQDALGRHHDHRERALLSRRPVIRGRRIF